MSHRERETVIDFIRSLYGDSEHAERIIASLASLNDEEVGEFYEDLVALADRLKDVPGMLEHLTKK